MDCGRLLCFSSMDAILHASHTIFVVERTLPNPQFIGVLQSQRQWRGAQEIIRERKSGKVCILAFAGAVIHVYTCSGMKTERILCAETFTQE